MNRHNTYMTAPSEVLLPHHVPLCDLFLQKIILLFGYLALQLKQIGRPSYQVLVTTIDAQWEGMGDVGSARYEPALLPHARP